MVWILVEWQECFCYGVYELFVVVNLCQFEDIWFWDCYVVLVVYVKVFDVVCCQDLWVQVLVFDVVCYLYLWGDYQGCQELVQDVFEIWCELFGLDYFELLWIVWYFGYILMFNGQYVWV